MIFAGTISPKLSSPRPWLYIVYLQAFRVLNFGYASALSMALFLIVLVVGLLGLAVFGLRREVLRPFQ